MAQLRRVAIITGASSGIGLETARALAGAGWRIIATGRDPGRCEAARVELEAAAGEDQVAFLQADLSSMKATARLASEITELTDRVELLVNNAGGMVKDLQLTDEGLEACFAGNHLGPFLLTNRLLPLLRRAAQDSPPASVRIINTSSDGSEMIPGLNFADLQNLDHWSPGAAYCSGKLANVMFARGLASRLSADGILAFSVHPGTVASNFISHVPDSARQHMETLATISPAEGADTLVWLATAAAAELENGGYYCRRQPRQPNPQADDQSAVDSLWHQSEELVAASGEPVRPWT